MMMRMPFVLDGRSRTSLHYASTHFEFKIHRTQTYYQGIEKNAYNEADYYQNVFGGALMVLIDVWKCTRRKIIDESSTNETAHFKYLKADYFRAKIFMQFFF